VMTVQLGLEKDKMWSRFAVGNFMGSDYSEDKAGV
jgi:hypothetical protein